MVFQNIDIKTHFTNCYWQISLRGSDEEDKAGLTRLQANNEEVNGNIGCSRILDIVVIRNSGPEICLLMQDKFEDQIFCFTVCDLKECTWK